MHPWRGRSRPPQADLPLRDPDAALGERHPQLIACESFLGRPVRKFDGVPAHKGDGPRSRWGQAWVANLHTNPVVTSSLDNAQTYLRNGLIWNLEIDRGEIRAIVLGSQLYAQRITVEPLRPEGEARLLEACSGRIPRVENLLEGQLDDDLFETLSAPGDGLLPRANRFQSSCMCPEGRGLCKHAAAVLFAVGLRLDERPHLLFTLRGTDPDVLKGLLPDTLHAPLPPEDDLIPEVEIARVFDLRLNRPVAQVEAPAPAIPEDDPLSAFIAGASTRPEPQPVLDEEALSPPSPPPPVVTSPASRGTDSWLDDDWEEDDEDEDIDAEVFGGPGPSPVSVASGEEGEDVLEIGRADLLEIGIPSHRIQRWLSDGTLLRTDKRGQYQLTPEAWLEIEPLLPTE